MFLNSNQFFSNVFSKHLIALENLYTVSCCFHCVDAFALNLDSVELSKS